MNMMSLIEENNSYLNRLSLIEEIHTYLNKLILDMIKSEVMCAITKFSNT